LLQVKYPVNLDWCVTNQHKCYTALLLSRTVAAAVALLRGYVIFDWDNIFATYMTSLSSKEIAYSNFIQVIRSKTAMGFVPNYSAGGTKVSKGAIKAILTTLHLPLYV
jgi:hypothetical protein